MKRVLPGTFYQKVVCFILLSIVSVSAFANNPFLSGSHKQINHTFSLIIIAPTDIAVNTDPWSNTATGVSLGKPSVSVDNGTTYTLSNNAPAAFPIGITKVIWTVTDNNGNIATVTQNVTVTDNQKPNIFRMGEISVVNDLGKCGAVVDLFIPYADDNSGLPVTITNDAPSFFQVGSTLIVWTATDAFGNSDTSTQLITVIDNELPSIKIANVTAFTDAGKNGATVNLGTPDATDNCGVVTVTNNAPAFFPTGTTLVTWTATDKIGYTNSVIQTVTVVDNEKPVITATANITLKNTTGKCGAASSSLVAPSVSDNCGVSSVTHNAPALLPTGNTIVTWTATDVNGNTSTITQTVMVQDGEAPVVTVPADVIVSCNAIPALVNPVVTDNCDASPVVTFSQVSTQSSNTNLASRYNYTITRTWIAKDISGNMATAKQVITVTDKTAPSLSVPANITVSNDINKCGASVRYSAATATDICGSPVTITYSAASNSFFPSGTTVVTVTAKDVSGNIATKTFTVKVNDTQRPSVIAPADLNFTVSSLAGTITNLNLGLPVTSDNCGVKSVGNNAPAVFPVGTTRVTWTVTDNSGNTSTDVQKVNVSVSAGSGALKRTGAIADGSTVNKTTMAIENEMAVEELKILVAPNPSSSYFLLTPQSKFDTPITLKMTAANGRLIETRSKLAANQSIQVGGSYLTGIYYVEMIQGAQHTVVQLIKVK